MGLVLALEMIPTGLSVLSLLLTGLFFLRLSKGHTWSLANIRMLWRVGLLCIGAPLLWPVIDTSKAWPWPSTCPPGREASSCRSVYHPRLSTRS